MNLSKAMKTAIERVETALTEHRKIEVAIANTAADLQRLEIDREEARARLGTEEAEAAISGDGSKTSPARKMLAALRDEIEAVEARAIGLQTRLTVAEDALYEARKAFAAARDEFMAAERQKLEEEWEQLLEEQVFPFLRRAAAVYIGAWPHRPAFARWKWTELDSSNQARKLFAGVGDEYGLEAALPKSDAAGVFAEYRQINTTVRRLDDRLRPIERARKEAAEAEDRRRRNAPSNQRSAVQTITIDPEAGNSRFDYEIEEFMTPGTHAYGGWRKFAKGRDSGKSAEELKAELRAHPVLAEKWELRYQREKNADKAGPMAENGRSTKAIAAELGINESEVGIALGIYRRRPNVAAMTPVVNATV